MKLTDVYRESIGNCYRRQLEYTRKKASWTHKESQTLRVWLSVLTLAGIRQKSGGNWYLCAESMENGSHMFTDP